MKFLPVGILIAGFALLAVWSVEVGAVQVQGTLIGEKCAKKIEVVNCSLKDSWPLAIFTDDGTYFVVESDGVDRSEFDRIFGLEVLAEGTIEGNVMKVAQIKSLVPVKSKEFTKG